MRKSWLGGNGPAAGGQDGPEEEVARRGAEREGEGGGEGGEPRPQRGREEVQSTWPITPGHKGRAFLPVILAVGPAFVYLRPGCS